MNHALIQVLQKLHTCQLASSCGHPLSRGLELTCQLARGPLANSKSHYQDSNSGTLLARSATCTFTVDHKVTIVPDTIWPTSERCLTPAHGLQRMAATSRVRGSISQLRISRTRRIGHACSQRRTTSMRFKNGGSAGASCNHVSNSAVASKPSKMLVKPTFWQTTQPFITHGTRC